MFYVYVLENKDNKLSIGVTNNLRRRLKEHNQGENIATKRNTWHCIYYEANMEESDARRREKYLKTNQGARLLKRRLKNHFYKQRAS